MRKPLLSERYPPFSECKPSINRVKITLELIEKSRLSLETKTSTKFSSVKPRLDKLNGEISKVNQVKLIITNRES